MLTVSNISIGYAHSTLAGNLSFQVNTGECILLCGPNGCGKSTLLKTLAGELKPIKGNIEGPGHDKISMIPSGILKVKGFTLKEFIRTSFYRESNWAGKLSAHTEEKIRQAMDSLGILQFADRDISQLSDGEFQKGCIASAIARRSQLIILDEPTAFLDAGSRISMLKCLSSLAAEESISVIFSSHDLHDSIKLSSRVIGLSAERVFADSGAEATKEERLKCARSCFPLGTI